MIDWTRLFHARGVATDIPGQLAALRGTDRSAAFDASMFLWSHLFAGDRLAPATAPTMRLLGEMLNDPALGAGDDGIRDNILFFIREIARVATGADVEKLRGHIDLDDTAVAWLDDYLAQPHPPGLANWIDTDAPGRVLLDAALVACADLLPDVFATVWPIPAGWAPWTRAMAGTAAVMLVRHPALDGSRHGVIAFHEDEARAATDRRACASYVIGLGELGLAPHAWLGDPRLAVRTCAALAPALAADDTATEILVRAAEHPRAFDHAFTEPFTEPAYRLMIPPQFERFPHRQVIRTVCERVTDFRRLVAAAVAAVDLRTSYRPIPEFGPYLPVAFPAGLPDDGTISLHQQAFARAIADRDDLWDGTYHGVPEMLAAAGLPQDRESWSNVRMATNRDAAGRAVYESTDLLAITAAQAVRKRPAAYLGVTRSSPDLLRNLLGFVATDNVSVRTTAPLRFTAEGNGTLLAASDVEAIATARAIGNPEYFALGAAAAVSLWVTVHWWADGVAYRQQFVDHTEVGPIQTLGSANRADGFRIDFELDREWLPPGAHFPR